MIKYQYFREPSPHVVFPELLPPATYARLVFPHIEPGRQGRTGRDLYPGEPGYDTVIASPGWRELHALFTSPEFVAWLLNLFGDDLARLHCKVDPRAARVEPFVEPRELIYTSKHAISEKDAHSVFPRFDIQAADNSYGRAVHLDHTRRLMGGILFLSDFREEGLEGGEFALYRDRLFRNDRECLWPELMKTFPVVHNTGVMFLNGNDGFHAPMPVRRLTGLRKFVLYNLSSHQPVWSAQPSTPQRRFALRVTRRLSAMKQQFVRQGR